MKLSLLVAAGAAILLFSAPAFAQDSPTAAAAACKAEYMQLGPAGFAAKYGQGEDGMKACLEAHGATPPAGPSGDGQSNAAAAACKAEYIQLGPAGFAAKYGQGGDGMKACLEAHGATPPSGQGGDDHPSATELVSKVAAALCRAAGTTGDGLGACVKAKLAQAQAIVSSCQSSAGSSTQALMACLQRAVGLPAPTPPSASSLAAVIAAVQACATSAGTSLDAYRQCVFGALRPSRR